MATFSREQFPRAVSAFGTVMSLSSVIGPILAGFIIQANVGGLDWRPVLLINIVLGLVGSLSAVQQLAAAMGSAVVTTIFFHF